MGTIWDFIKARLCEASTYRGLAILLTLFGIQLNPEQVKLIAGFGAAAVAVIGIFFPDKKESCQPKQ